MAAEGDGPVSDHTITRRRPTFATIPRDLLRDPEISPAAKTVYALLDDYASPDSPMPFPSQATLAKILGGVTDRCVRNWLTELREAGWITVHKRPGSNGNEYALEDRAVRVAERQFRRVRNDSSGATGTSVPTKESQDGEPAKDTPLPLAGEGGVQPELFAPGAGGAVTTRERKTRAGGKVAEITEGAYRSWLEIRWPKGNRGSVPAGSRAFAKAVKGGATMEEIDRQTVNYVAARAAYHEAWKGVGNYWPSLMNVSTFLNGKRTMFDREWGLDDLRYWPAPAGWSWDDRPVSSHDAGEVPAEVAAQGGLAVAMWRAERRKAAEAGAVAGG